MDDKETYYDSFIGTLEKPNKVDEYTGIAIINFENTAITQTVTFDFQYPDNYFTPNVDYMKKTSFEGKQNESSGSTGNLDFSDFVDGDSLKYSYKAKWEDLVPVDGQTYFAEWQGQGNVHYWTSKISIRETPIGTGEETFTYESAPLTGKHFDNSYYAFNFRFDYYESGSFTASDFAIYRVHKENYEKSRGSNLGTLPTPKNQKNYKFLGWYTEPSGGVKVDENTIINENTTLYARWDKLKLDINIFFDDVHVDKATYTGDLRNAIKFDFYLNGEKIRDQVSDYSTNDIKVGDTYEIKNINYDTTRWTLLDSYMSPYSSQPYSLSGTISQEELDKRTTGFIEIPIAFKAREWNITYDLDGGTLTTANPTKNIAISNMTGNRTYVANYEKEGVYAKLCDTTSDGKGDLLLLNNYSNFECQGTLINDYNNQDDNEYQKTNNLPIWNEDAETITKVNVLNKISIITGEKLFYNFQKLTQIKNIKNIDTSQVTNMDNMFGKCAALESLDLSNFNTSNVTNMYGMFREIESIQKIDLSSFDFTNVTDMGAMFTMQIPGGGQFNKNTILKEIIFPQDKKISNVIKINDLFSGLTNLKSIDLSMFETSNVTTAYHICNGSGLKTIYATDKFILNTYEDGVFLSCLELAGGNGTTYNANKIDTSYAKIDAYNQKGYLTSKEPLPKLTLETWVPESALTDSNQFTSFIVAGNTYNFTPGGQYDIGTHPAGYWRMFHVEIENVLLGTEIKIVSGYGAQTRWALDRNNTANNEHSWLGYGSTASHKMVNSDYTIFAYPDVGGANKAYRRIYFSTKKTENVVIS